VILKPFTLAEIKAAVAGALAAGKKAAREAFPARGAA
jgi:hypothetical protein